MRLMRSWEGLAALGSELAAFLHEAMISFRRNGLMTVAAVTTVLVTLLTVGGAVLAGLNFAQFAQILDAQVEIVAYVADGLSWDDLSRLERAVAESPGVAAFRFVGRAEALKRLQQRLGGTAAFADLADANPLPDSFEVRVVDPRRVPDVAASLRQQHGITEVSFGGQVVERLTTLTRGVRVLATIAVVLLASVALIIVVNTIRLTVIARRTEIEIMELVGATRWFIRWPFLIEGILQGALAALAAALVLSVAYTVAIHRLHESIPFLPTVAPGQAVLPLLIVVLTMGIALGAAGSALAVRRFLRS